MLLLSDGRPGHYHLADGVIAAMARVRPVDIERLAVQRRKLAPARLLAQALRGAALSPVRAQAVLKLGYGIDARTLPKADLVISAGGDTIAANVAAASVLGVPNIFCGSLRHVPPERFALIVSSYQRHAHRPRHLICLKPSGMDPDQLGRPLVVPRYGPANRPARAALLIGGDSGLFHYQPDEWRALLGFLPALHQAWGTRWLVSTSRRTPDWVADAVAELAAASGAIERVIDYRTVGPGTLPSVFANCDAVLCTEDSSTMISEAIAARLPVVGIAPMSHSFKPEEAEYRAFMLAQNWCRFLPMATLSIDSFGSALNGVTPMASNHLDALAQRLVAALPEFFAG